MATRTTQTVVRFSSAFRLPGLRCAATGRRLPRRSRRRINRTACHGLPGNVSARLSTSRQSPCGVRRNKWYLSFLRISMPRSKRTTSNHDRAGSTRLTPARSAASTPSHLFTVGQVVRLKAGFGIPTLWADIYRIIGTLPPLGNSPQYRIRDYDERHERVTTEDTLEPVGLVAAGHDTTLIERTFGHGQGTETQQSRD